MSYRRFFGGRSVLLSVVTALLVLSSVFVSAVSAEIVPELDRETTIIDAADRLVSLQNNDGGFTWELTDPAGASTTNTFGVTAMGILKAHELLDKPAYETSLAKAYKYVVDNVPEYTGTVPMTETSPGGVDSWPDITFLIELAKAAKTDESLLAEIRTVMEDPEYSDTDIAALAKARYEVRKAAKGPTTADMAEWIMDFRQDYSSGYGFWEVRSIVDACLSLESYYPEGINDYHAQALSAAEVINKYLKSSSNHYFDIEETAQYDYTLGISGAIESFSELGIYPELTANMTSNLIAYQDSTGFWNEGEINPVADGSLAESVQATAYAVMSLIVQGEPDAREAAIKAGDWLVTEQAEKGGWNTPYEGAASENLEVDGEAAWALTRAPAPITIGTKEYYSIQSAVDSASPGNTINVATGTYTEVGQLGIDKSLNIIGVGQDDVVLKRSGGSSYFASVTAPSFTMKDLTIDATNSDTSNFIVHISGSSDVTVQDVSIIGQGKNYTTDGEAYRYINPSDTNIVGGLDLINVGTANIVNVIVSNTSRNGISFTNVGNINLDGFTVQDCGHSDSTGWAGLAAYLTSGSSTLTLSGTNTITNTPIGVNVEDSVTLPTIGSITLSNTVIPVGAPNNINSDTFAQDVTNTPYKVYTPMGGPAGYFATQTDAINSAIAGKIQYGWDYVVYDLNNQVFIVGNGMSIQTTIDAASDGDTVNVAAGTYTAKNGALAIIDKPLTILGNGQSGLDASILDGGTYGSGQDTSGIGNGWTRAIIVRSSGVTIQNLKIVNFQGNGDVGGYCIVARGESSWTGSEDKLFTGLTFRDITLEDCLYGIRLSKTDGAIIEGITYDVISGFPDYGIYATSSPNAVIQNNILNSGSIWLTGNSHNGIINNNRITNAPYNGIWFGMQFDLGTSSENCFIVNNTINGAEEGGIVISNMHGDSTGKIEIVNNTVKATKDVNNEHHGGISIISGVFPNLIIQRNTLENNVHGISLHTEWSGNWDETTIKNAIVSDNVIKGNENGILINTLSGLTMLIENIIIENNLIYGNVNYGILNNEYIEINSTLNWWGHLSGPYNATSNPGGQGDKVKANVDFDPWYLGSAMTELHSTEQTVLVETTTITGETDKDVVIPPTNPPATITIPDTVTDATLNLAPIVTKSADENNAKLAGSLDITVSTTSLGDITVQIPAETTITGDTSWTGKVAVPTVKTTPSTTVTATTSGNVVSQVTSVIEIGFGDIELTFDKAVRLVIPGKAGQSAGYTRGGVFTPITDTCPSATSQSQVDAWFTAYPGKKDCKINYEGDLVIWTRHFTEFVTYTETTPPAAPPAPTGGGGGGGGGMAPYLTVRIVNPVTAVSQSASSSAIYTVDVENTGSTDGTFSLAIDGLPAAYYTVSDPIRLTIVGAGGKTGKLQYTLKLPADAVDTTFTVTVKAVAGLVTGLSSYKVTLAVLSASAAATTTTTTPGITIPALPGLVIPTGAITGAVTSLSERGDVRLAAGGVAAAAIAVFGVRTFARRSRTPWRNDYYKPKFQSDVLEVMKKQVKRRFADEDWVRRL